MVSRRVALLAAAIALAAAAAVLLVLRLTEADEPPRRAAVAAPPEEPPLPPRAAPPAPPPADDSGCPPALRAAETLRADRLDERWAMCRLFGSYDAAARASSAPGERVEVVSSSEFREGAARRHLLVVARRAASGDVPLAGRAASARLDAHVYARDAGAWRLAASGGSIAEAGPGGRVPSLRLLAVGPRRSALLVTPAGGQAEGFARLVGVSADGVALLADELPAGGESEAGCVSIRCFSWRADLAFSRSRGEYDDLLVHVHGTRPDDDERVWPVDETVRWVLRDGRYRLDR